MLNRKNRRNEYGEKWAIAVALMDNPLGIDEIEHHFSSIGRRIGFFHIDSLFHANHEQPFKQWLQGILKNMQEINWVIKKDTKYELTEKGRKEAELAYNENVYAGKIVKRALNPYTVSTVTFIVHLLLAAIKLPAALISGSVGLLSDSLDTLADALSSLFVFVGIRKNKERLANTFLVFLMIVTGGLTLYKAVSRFLAPSIVAVDTYTFIAVILSALICMVLWGYQRYTGIKTNTPALVTQSIDSRNHVFAACSVIAGLIAAKLNFVWLDIAVGLVVALLICKTAIELLLELVRGDNEEDLTGNKIFFSFYSNYKDQAYRLWILQTIKENKIQSKQELIDYIKQQTDTSGNRSLMAFEKDHFTQLDNQSVAYVNDLILQTYITETNPISLTAKGQTLLENKGKKTIKHFLTCSFLLWYLAEFILLHWGITSLSELIGAESLGLRTLRPIIVWNTNYSLPGFITLLVGAMMYVYGRYHVRKISILLKRQKKNTLLTEGYFKRVRHPMYGMFATIQVGLLSSANYKWTLILSVIFFLAMYVNALTEERQLISIYKESYWEYMKSTKAILFSKKHFIVLIAMLLNNITLLIGLY